MKRLVIIIMLSACSVPLLSSGQSMARIFKLLPPECTPDIDFSQRDTLLKSREYVLPGTDNTETVRYDLKVDEARNYLKYEYYYSTGQKGFNTYEVRKFKRKDGSWLIVFSAYGGLTKSYDLAEIYGFDYRFNKLIRLKGSILPGHFGVNTFLKHNTPDSIKADVRKFASLAYDLSPDLKNGLAYCIFFQSFNDTIDSYLLGDVLDFIWTGESLKRGKLKIFE